MLEWNGQQPPELIPLIGRKVQRAWVFGDTLAILIDGGRFLQVDPVPFFGEGAAVALKVGTVKDTANLVSDLDARIEQNPHTEELRAMTFTGIDANIVMFGDYGARVTPAGVEWMKTK